MLESKSSFEGKCNERVGAIASRSSLRYVVCVDGSAASEAAFDLVMNIRKKYDFVAVYHATKEQDGSFVQPNWRPAAIQQHYDVELTSHLLPERYSITLEPRGDKSFMSTLTHALSQYEDSKLIRDMGNHYPDFVVFGVVGRKGFKGDKKTLGTNALGALNDLHYPCIVVKRPIQEIRRTFIFAVNLSSQSKQGLDLLLQLIRPKDSLTLIHMYDDSEGDTSYFAELKEYYTNELENFGPAESAIRMVAKPRGLAVTQAIANYVNEIDPDFFAIAPRAKVTISSISTYIVNHVDCNVILAKV